MKKIFCLWLVACFTYISGALAKIEVINVWIKPAQEGANSVLVLKIVNTANEADKLIQVQSNATPRIEFLTHEEDNGIMKKTKLQFIHIPALGNIELGPAGPHVMLLELDRTLKPGDVVDVNIHFEKGGQFKLRAPVQGM